jgi:hypothetical protein
LFELKFSFDGSDEEECAKGNCKAGQMMCNNGRCIDEHLWCDGSDDCPDSSDERNCTLTQPSEKQMCNSLTEYTCPGETPLRCIKYENLCDKRFTANDCTKSVCGNKISELKKIFF